MRAHEILKSKLQEMLDSKEADTLRQLAETSGLAAVQQYIEVNVHRWKEEQVKFAVTGRCATGKSTFINAMREVGPGDPTFAKSGSGNTTQKPEAYEHPKNRKLLYYDLPGLGTLHFQKDDYIRKMKIIDYDYFLIFFDKVISEDDSWIILMLKELHKPFCLVRSKLDDDIKNAKYDGKNEKEVIPDIRRKIYIDIQKHNFEHPDNIIDVDDIFLISSREKTLGDMDRLLDHIEKKLPSIKFEVMIRNMSSISEVVIEKKYNMLKKGIFIISVYATNISALRVPGCNVPIDTGIILTEINNYIRIFGLTRDEIKTLSGLNMDKLKCRYVLTSAIDIETFVVSELGKTIKESAIQLLTLPLFGSFLEVSQNTLVVYAFLSSFLDDIRDDAKLVFDLIAAQTAQTTSRL